jgi:hypothetical protein
MLSCSRWSCVFATLQPFVQMSSTLTAAPPDLAKMTVAELQAQGFKGVSSAVQFHESRVGICYMQNVGRCLHADNSVASRGIQKPVVKCAVCSRSLHPGCAVESISSKEKHKLYCVDHLVSRCSTLNKRVPFDNREFSRPIHVPFLLMFHSRRIVRW